MAHTQYACRRRNTGTLRIAGTLAAIKKFVDRCVNFCSSNFFWTKAANKGSYAIA